MPCEIISVGKGGFDQRVTEVCVQGYLALYLPLHAKAVMLYSWKLRKEIVI